MPQQDPYASIATADPYASIAAAAPVYRDPYGTPQHEVEDFLSKNPDYEWVDQDPRFPLRQPGIYPKAAAQNQIFQTGKLKGQIKPPEMQTDEWPVDLHEAHHLYQGAKLGATAATAPMAFEASVPGLIGGVVGGTAGSAAAKRGAQALGAGETGQEVAGDVGGVAGGVAGGGVADWMAPKLTTAAVKARALWESLPGDVRQELSKHATGMALPENSRITSAWKFGKAMKGLYDRFFGAGSDTGAGEAPTQDADVIRERIGNSQPSTPLDRLRNQEIPPEVNYTPDRPSIERIMPEKTAGEAGSMAASVATPQPSAQSNANAESVNSLFPPPGPKGKFQYDPNRFNQPGRGGTGATFDTNGIMRDIDEDNAIEDAMRADLGKHGYISRIQQNREFAAGHSMDTPKGTLQEQAQNTRSGAALVDAGVQNMGSPIEPIEFLNNVKGFKLHGRWLMRQGDDWVGVTNQEMKNAITGAAGSSASSGSASQDLTDEWSRNVAYLKAQKAKKPQ